MDTILLLLLLSSFALAQKCSMPGDCMGTSLDIDAVGSERECLEHCQSTEGCEWYTYDAYGGFCNALLDCPEIDANCTTCIHGESECQLPLRCFIPGECHGAYITHIYVPTAEECLERCYHDDPTCQHFSFFAENNMCTFFGTCSLDHNQTGVVSGKRDCHREDQERHTKIFLQTHYNTGWMHMPSVYESGNGTECHQPADYPLKIYGPASQVINVSVTLCGGGYSSNTTNECFSHDATLNVWVEFPPMDIARLHATSIMTPGGWWVTGGIDWDEVFITSSLWDGSIWKAGPDLPSFRYGHCLVQLNSSHIFLAGGFKGMPLSDAYLFDWTMEVWTQLPNMTLAQTQMGCGLYQDDKGGDHIVSAGGFPDGNLVQSFDLHKSEWMLLPDLPSQSANSAYIVRDGDALILVAPSSVDKLYRFNKRDQTFSLIDQPLPVIGTAVVLAISDASLSGCN